MNNELLVAAAKEAMEKAYVPYSHFKVGAAVVSKDGTVFTGCNIENSSYGATICAERTAMVKAVSEGHLYFEKIAIVSSSGEYTHPCGICRQFMVEFCDKNTIIILNDDQKGIIEIPFNEELPNSFTKDSIK